MVVTRTEIPKSKWFGMRCMINMFRSEKIPGVNQSGASVGLSYVFCCDSR